MSCHLSSHLKYGVICIVLITFHIVVLFVILDYQDVAADKPKNGDNVTKRSSQMFNQKPSIMFISANKHGFKTKWTQVILKNEPQIDGYKVILWELKNVTNYVEVKNSVTKKIKVLKQTRYPETVTEWNEAYMKDRSVQWVIKGKYNTTFNMKHSIKPYTWYDLEIVTLINGEEGPSERNNRFQVSN